MSEMKLGMKYASWKHPADNLVATVPNQGTAVLFPGFTYFMLTLEVPLKIVEFVNFFFLFVLALIPSLSGQERQH